MHTYDINYCISLYPVKYMHVLYHLLDLYNLTCLFFRIILGRMKAHFHCSCSSIQYEIIAYHLGCPRSLDNKINVVIINLN